VPCTNADELAALRITYANDKDYVEALRDEIRVRHHVYGIAPGVLLQIGSAPANATELARLEGELQAEVVKVLPPKPPGPTPYPVREKHKTPTAQAATAHEAYVARVAAAWEELGTLTNDFIFRAPRERTQRANRASTRALQQEVSPRDAALCGVTFTEDDVNWKVLAVTWSPTEEEVVVWYYDVDAAAEDEVTEDEMERHTSEFAAGNTPSAPCPDVLERSTVMEIRSWIYGFEMSLQNQ